MSRNGCKWSIWKTYSIVISLVVTSHLLHLISAEGNIGCLFADTLCLDGVEFCFDDYAFGICLPKYSVDPEEVNREPLDEEQSHILATMLEELQGADLGWEDPFVQCRMKDALYAVRNNVRMAADLCTNLVPNPKSMGPQSPLAYVRFMPPNNNFADEVYYPTADKKSSDQRFVDRSSKTMQPIDKLTSLENYDFQPEARILYEPNEQQELFMDEPISSAELENRVKDIQNRIELRKMLAEYEAGNLKPPHYYKNMVVDDINLSENGADQSVFQDQPYFIPNYKRNDHSEIREPDTTSTSFREISRKQKNPLSSIVHHQVIGFKGPYDLDYSNNVPSIELPINRGLPYPIDPNESGVYTEGGLVYVPDSDTQGHSLDRKQEARTLLANMLGFTRHERLDVKKPGPPAAPPPSSQSPDKLPESILLAATKTEHNKEVLPNHMTEDVLPKIKKVLHTDNNHGPYSIDTEYTHVILKSPVDSWDGGKRIIDALAATLSMEGYFTYPEVNSHQIAFRVEDNPQKKTAIDIVKQINDGRFKTNFQRRYGIHIIQAGPGNKVKDPVSAAKIDYIENNADVTHVMAFMFAGAGAAAVVVIVITLFLIRRHDQKRSKLGGLRSGLSGTETCTKDYQELCRARMAGGKGTSCEGVTSSGRVASLSKENDRPPSSRSSTSSWSEEPALTNMDISTGHMVLSYMEDHLKNKGRLQREWEALCRYEAEPSARDAALQSQCATLNRPGAPLPYDHSRVVLNHLANAEGLDYINASTITDHDPRAPAYVAAQGPLPSTLAHFWQMIWEQGAVVIVALCRLQENGEIACARYWPEEGAEVYHIYEVHLVSEHIWCDDYLVRSFYLKNLRTSETRTVTQFHFLSWPQNGSPATAKALLEFRRKVNKSYRGRSCPIVVHGSSGAGRTGAYILLDLVLGRMNKGAREIDIAATLEHLRDQRVGLVATKQQFEFVLMAVAEEVHAILKALPTNAQTEKRELDTEAVKEQDGEGEKSPKTTDPKQSDVMETNGSETPKK